MKERQIVISLKIDQATKFILFSKNPLQNYARGVIYQRSKFIPTGLHYILFLIFSVLLIILELP